MTKSGDIKYKELTNLTIHFHLEIEKFCRCRVAIIDDFFQLLEYLFKKNFFFAQGHKVRTINGKLLCS